MAFNRLFHQIDGDIHIVGNLFGTDDLSLERDGDFDFMALLIDAERHIDLCVLGEILFELAEFFLDRLSKPAGDINVLTYDVNVHLATSLGFWNAGYKYNIFCYKKV